MHRHESCKEVLGLNRITKKRILQLCRKDKLYQTPELNDVLYLHYQGFDRIECLEDYTELKCLWLECNAISEIQGLDKQTKLKCLFLQSNLIRKIENLEYCRELDTLNLSQNHIRKIENCGFEVLPLLNTLNLASNYLKDCEGLEELKSCKNLSVLDLSNNRIDDILIVKIFSQMPELKVLVLQGNPVVSKIPQYRKTLILECKKLTYLDSRPVFPKDRACAESWKRGGYEEERKENELWNRQERKKMRDSVNATINLRNKHRKLTEQISLIPSSDSEEDRKGEKRARSIQSDTAKVSMDTSWDEVTEKNSGSSLTSNNSEEYESDQSKESSDDEGLSVDGKDNIEIPEDQSVKEEYIEKKSNTEKVVEAGLEIKTAQCILNKNTDIQTTTYNYIDHPDTVGSSDFIFKKSETGLERKTIECNLDKNHDVQTSNHKDMDQQSPVDSCDFKESETGFERKTIECNLDNNHDIQTSNHKDMNQQNPVDSCDFKESQTGFERKTIEYNLDKNHDIQTSNHKDMDQQNPVDSCDFKESETGFERKTIECNLDKNHDIQTSNHKDMDQQNPVDSCDFKESETGFERKTDDKNYDIQTSNYNDIDKQNPVLSSESKFNSFDLTENDVEGKYELLKELDESMNVFSKKVKTDHVLYQSKAKAEEVISEAAMQQEYLKVNNKFKFDFEKLSSNMNDFVNQLEKEQEERQEIIKVLFCKEIAPKESSSESSDNDYVDSSEKPHLERVTDRWDKENKNIEYAANQVLTRKKQIKANAPEIEINKKVTENKGDFVDIETVLDRKISEKDGSKELNASFEYIPLDISSLTHKSTAALNSLERESKILKDLLLKLENDNENTFKDVNLEEKFQTEDINCKNEVAKEELNLRRQKEMHKMFERNNSKASKDKLCYNSYIEEEKFQEEVTNHEEFQKKIVEQILEEVLQSIHVMYIGKKSYALPRNLPDFNEEIDLTYSESVSKSIPDAIKSFNHFFSEIDINERANNENSFENIYNQQDELLSMTELPKGSKVKQFNSDTLQNLDEQLEEIKRNQQKKVRRMVDRVYAQKDQYKDTLEIVDGKLMIRNQYTKELRDLPQPAQYKSSDSEDYDTAESGDEEHNTRECLRKTKFRQSSFKSTARNLSEDVIIKPLAGNKSNRSNDASDESNDEFFSLDCQVKPNLSNIDKEFVNKLKFDEPNLREIDESHIVQCVRSYEELKTFLTLNKEETLLTELEQEMLDNMIRSKLVKTNENPKTLSGCLQYNSDLTKQERLWLNKMTLTAQQTKSQEKLGLQSRENACDDILDRNELEKSLGNMLTKTFSRDISKAGETDNTFNDSMTNKESLLIEQSSEEEKNEIESNTDFHSCAADANITDCGDMPQKFQDAFEVDEMKGASTECTSREINVEKSAKATGDIGILGCRLEIIGDNDENVHPQSHL